MLINEQIRANEVLLLTENGEQLGVVSLQDALLKASSQNLDLVLINASSKPPVCKIMNYGKFKYDSIKREKEIKKNQKVSELKTIKIKRMTIDKHDLEIKAKSIIKFLQNGDKVNVILWMRKGREQMYTSNAMKVMEELFEMVKDYGVVDKNLQKLGKDVTMTIIPKK